MENKEIFELLERFEKSKLTRMEIERQQEGLRINFEKEPARQDTNIALQACSVSSNAEGEVKTENTEVSLNNGYEVIKSPIVGVFYKAPAPGEAPFVEEGQRIEKGQTMCLVEAMKMMSELKSPVSGIVRSIMGVDGEMVEYDQPLFEVEPC